MKNLTQTLTEVYEGFKLRKEKKRLEEFVDSMGGFTLMCVYGENKKNLPCACGCSECYTERFPALPGCGMPTFSNEEQQKLKGLIQQEPRFAKKTNEWGFGTTEDILVDYRYGETIKIYTDILGNKIDVKYGIHGTEHKEESCITLDTMNKKKNGSGGCGGY